MERTVTDSMRQISFMEDSKVRKHIINVMRSIAFLMILAISLHYINQVLMPKYILSNNTWPTTSSYNQFYEMEKDSIDVLFLGSSFAVNAFSPQEIYNVYGIRSYNLGSEQQSIFLSYFWLKEALRFQSPKVVVLDTFYLLTVHPEDPINTAEELTRKCLDPMKWSLVKKEAVSDLCELDETQSELSYYLTNIRFHTRWAALSEYDMVYDEVRNSELKGYGPIAEYGESIFYPYTPSGDTETKIGTNEVMQTYLDKIVDLCKENGITFVLVSLPGNIMNDRFNNTLTSYAYEKQIDYYNLCEANIYNSIGATLPKESVVDHENLWGAMKMSQYIGGLMKDVYNVEAVEDDQYESTREFYDRIIKNCELVHITDINEYLQTIYDDNYTIFIVSRAESMDGLTDQVMENLHAMGLNQDLLGKFGWSYSAVVSPENGISEILLPDEYAELSGSIRNRNTFYTIIGSGQYTGPNSYSSIIIDGTEYCRDGGAGLNFVIYDNYLMKVVDSVTFKTGASCAAVR